MTAYLIVYGRDLNDRFAVHRFETRAQALAAKDLVPAVPVDGYGKFDPEREARPGVGGGWWLIESEEDAFKLAGPTQVGIYRALTGDGPTRFESRSVGARRLIEALEAKAPHVHQTESKEEKAMAEENATRGRRPRFTPDQRIEVLVTENPKKPGKKNHERFAALMSLRNPTVKDAVEAGVSLGDLAYDQEHGFIRIHPSEARQPTAAAAE